MRLIMSRVKKIRKMIMTSVRKIRRKYVDYDKGEEGKESDSGHHDQHEEDEQRRIVNYSLSLHHLLCGVIDL